MRGVGVVKWVLGTSLLGWSAGCGDDVGTPSTGDSTGAGSTGTGVVPPPSGSASAEGGLDVTGASSSTGTDGPAASSSDGATDLDTGVATIGGELCGDGRVDEGEECDDGNNDDGDTCSASCTLLVEVAWTDIYDGPASASDAARAVVVDSDDSIWVLGSQAVVGASELWLRHYAADGTPQETFTWVGPEGLGAGGYDLAWMATGDLAIVGYAVAAATGGDILVARFDPAAQALVWSRTIDGPGTGAGPLDSDLASRVVVAPSGDLVVAGAVAVDDAAHDLWSSALDVDGEPLWAQTWGGDAAGEDFPLGLVVGDDGGSATLAYSAARPLPNYPVVTLAADGTSTGLPDLDFGDPWQGDTMLSRGDGRVLVAGFNGAGAWIWEVDADWQVLGQAMRPQFSFVHALAVDLERIFAAGHLSTPGAPDAWIAAFDQDGIVVWSDAYDHPVVAGQDRWSDVAVDSTGDVVVVGETQTVKDGPRDIIVRKYHPL